MRVPFDSRSSSLRLAARSLRTFSVEVARHERAFGSLEARRASRMAGWTGLEPDPRRFSKLVMARNFWLKRFNHIRLRRFASLTAVHPSSPVSTLVVEKYWRRPRAGKRVCVLRARRAGRSFS